MLWPGDGRLGLAVSGGADSLALLLLAHAALPGRIEAATIDHGLRPEAADEAQLVARICADLAVPHQTIRVIVAPGNLQDQARHARYAALGNWMEQHSLAALATAHHADDQAETLLMRLNRGSGVSGLAGVRTRGVVPGSNRPLLRPLLGWRRIELASIVQSVGLAPVQDPSNNDEQFDRVRMRKALAQADWIDPQAFAASARHLAQADAALQWAAAREWDECVQRLPGALHYRPVAPRAIRLRVVARAIAELGGDPRGGAVARLIDALSQGQGGTLGGVAARAEGPIWQFVAEPPRRDS